MDTLSAKYAPQDIESRWYAHWLEKNYFHSEPDEREAFSIVIPPPNVTGVLHMGHMLNNTIQDALIRKARLDGKNACWVAGTDHASIATEAKVVKWLREEKGLKKSDLSRDEFMKYAWEWKEKYGGIILNQLQKLGASCDWERTAFTMDEVRSQGVIKVFVDLYNKGKLYRDFRMVNWDPEAKTVLSNEEVLHGEEQSNLYHVRYKVEMIPIQSIFGGLGEEEFITIATQRPETIMGDTAIAVHPQDPRYAHLKGRKVIVPLVNRVVPIIFDEYVDREFGTGALKVTPAHDPNDYELGKKHGLEVIDTLTDDGKLNEKCELPHLVGLDRFEARKRMKKLLEAADAFVALEPYKTNIGRSERTGCVVEPKLSLQWYVDMKAIAAPALESVLNDEIEFFPKSFKNTYKYWMENIRDWCISRQLWWGHRVPAWYVTVPNPSKGGEMEKLCFVAETEAEAYEQYRAHPLYSPPLEGMEEALLTQDEDALDTWFSSWLWPITVFDGFNPESKDFQYYYPTNVLVTGWDIIFLWVARMAMAGYEWKQERPFKSVYFTGMVRDKQRRKMSKQLGNSPDALELIETFGADGVRFGMLSCSPAGGDLLFDDKLCEQGRNFCNKLWNALRLIKGWEVTEKPENEQIAKINALAAKWLNDKMDEVLAAAENDFKQFRLSEALMNQYKFIWDDFCAWYLEMIKPAYGQPIDRLTLDRTISLFERMMIMLHPFMPFITEEIWHQLRNRKEGNDVCVADYPKAGAFNPKFIQKVETAKELIAKIRETRNSKGIKMAEQLHIFVQETDNAKALYSLDGLREIVMKLGNLATLDFTNDDPSNSVSFLISTEKYFVQLEQTVDAAAEKERITKEMVYLQGFVVSVNKKLENERFVNNAPPQVLENERKKLADALSKIGLLEEELGKLG